MDLPLSLIIGINLFVYLYTYNSNLHYLTLIPNNVINLGEYWRIFTSCVTHINFLHLFVNMNSLIKIYPHLYYRIPNFWLTLFSLFVSFNIIYLFIAFILIDIYPIIFYTPVMGFSGILFGLIYLENNLMPNRTMNYMGMEINSQYYSFYLLFITQIFMQQSSFLGHLSGILGGMTTYYLLF